jgi:aldehyde dehydrogenase (NAD+)
VARKIKAGTVWINSTNLFDAASGFGGYRESGYGREGGKEGMYEYLRYAWPEAAAKETERKARKTASASRALHESTFPPIDRTPKMYIGGKQTRPDSGYSRLVYAPDGHLVGEVGEGNRKDIRNAVEAARTASKWADATGHARAQILYYLAENLAVRQGEFADRLGDAAGKSAEAASAEVERAIEQLFTYAAWADKFDGQVHNTPFRNLTLAVPEPLGVMGIVCPDDFPLLGFVALVAPPVAMGNCVVAVPSPTHPLSATDLYQVLETSDVPAGVINIVTGERNVLAGVLAEHDDVDGIWYVGDREGIELVEYASAGNMKRTWTYCEGSVDLVSADAPGQLFLRECTQVKNIWTPYGV